MVCPDKLEPQTETKTIETCGDCPQFEPSDRSGCGNRGFCKFLDEYQSEDWDACSVVTAGEYDPEVGEWMSAKAGQGLLDVILLVVLILFIGGAAYIAFGVS